MIILQFKSKFGKMKDITFPEELNGLEPITVYNEYSEDLHDYFRLSTLAINENGMPSEEPVRHNRRGSVQDLMESKGTHIPLKKRDEQDVVLEVTESSALPNTVESK